jgi:dipeptidase
MPVSTNSGLGESSMASVTLPCLHSTKQYGKVAGCSARQMVLYPAFAMPVSTNSGLGVSSMASVTLPCLQNSEQQAVQYISWWK